MLYNPDLYKAPSLRGMAEFCESKDPQEEYFYESSHICACAQYSHSIGMKNADWFDMGPNRPAWAKLNIIAGDGPRNFGALAKRLREKIDA